LGRDRAPERGPKMQKTIYRILATLGGLGYGFPEESFREAMKQKLDLIAADCGSIDPGPYYLGMGVSLQRKANMKRDFSIMLAGALEQGCPVIIGTCGLAGDTPNLMFMVNIAKEVCKELGVRDLKVAVIDGHVESDILIEHPDCLVPLGKMGFPSVKDISTYKIVGQMGIAPFIKALDEGAQVILAGRACDIAIYAAGPVRRGIDPGIAFHAGHVLECGCQACDPGTASDCLVAEFLDDESVVFTPPNKTRKATTYSVAAHSLYEEDHPTVHFYPEGTLSFEKTEYFEAGERSAGIRKSEFFTGPLTLKVEGSRKTGERYISVLWCKDLKNIPERCVVYGRNGVESALVRENEYEMGVLIKATSAVEETAKTLLNLWKGFFMHFGYPNRRSTAGNLAFPLSPSEVTYLNEKGEYVSFIISGTRDPFFQADFEEIRSTIDERMKTDYPEAVRQGRVEVLIGDRDFPIMFLETIGQTKEETLQKHRAELATLDEFIDHNKESLLVIYTGPFFEWGIYHIFTDAAVIREKLFPVSLYTANGDDWRLIKTVSADYHEIGKACADHLDPDIMNIISPVTQVGEVSGVKPLTEAARIIRSKNAGINKITYDIFFTTSEDYEAALNSNLFTVKSAAQILNVPLERMIGTYRADDCYAIKISVHREMVSGSPGDRDVFGAQQHMCLMRLQIPVFAK
jgi:hypothetical protein